MTNRSEGVPRAVRVILPLLVLLSGFCGISYEILYARLLGNLLGGQFAINATVLLTFLLGIGIGTRLAHRFVRWLWAIELGIGIYAALMAWGYPVIDRVLYTWFPTLGTRLASAAVVAMVLLVLPAFLVGCSVPLFAAYLARVRAGQAFAVTYGLYNVGAAMTALVMEFGLLRVAGLRGATALTAILNAVVALALIGVLRAVPEITLPPPGRLRFARRTVAGLFVASVASAVFQLLMIKLAEFVFGPYNETFALVLASVLIGLTLGALAAARLRLTFGGAMLLAMLGIAGILALFPWATEVYARLYQATAPSYPGIVLLKLAFVLGLMLVPVTAFGATIPVLLREHRHVARESGQLLFWSSMANALGFLLMAALLHRWLDYGPLLLLVLALAALAAALEGGLRRGLVAGVVLTVLLAGSAWNVMWNESLLYLGHMNFRSLDNLRVQRRAQGIAQRFKGPQDVFAITWIDDAPFFFINGYISIPLGGDKPTEEFVGSLSAMYSPRLDHALVLGLGSGATAGAVGLTFEHTDVVEINGAILANLDLLARYNFDLRLQPGVRIVHDDGIHHMKTTDQTYSLILNTVTSPQYFSSSKLYTTDFLQHVVRRLTPDGVYVTWIDQQLGDRGIDIILETLDQAFERCWLNYITLDYYFLACSNSTAGLPQIAAVAANPELRRHFAREYTAPLSLFPYAVLSTDALSLRSTTAAPVNTLDRPVLEFEMARLEAVGDELEGFEARLASQLDLDRLGQAMAPWYDWRRGGFAFFAQLWTEGDPALRRILNQAVDDAGVPAAEFEQAALDAARDVGTAEAWMTYGNLLEDRQRAAAAAVAYEAALQLEPDIEDGRWRLARARDAAGQVDTALAEYTRAWEQSRNPRAPLAAARSLLTLRRYDEALHWLAAAEQARPGQDRPEIALVRGLAHEGRGEIALARQSIEAALADSPDDPRLREALERLRR